MLRFRFLLPFLVVLFTAIIMSTVMAASKKSVYSVNDDYKISKDVKAYASDQKIDLDTAAHQLALQELAGI